MNNSEAINMQSRPRMYGKSTLVTNAFLADSKAGKIVRYQHPDYVCMSRKMYEGLMKEARSEAFEEAIQALLKKKGKFEMDTPEQLDGYSQAIHEIKEILMKLKGENG